MGVRTAAGHVSSITKDNRGGKVTIIASVPALSSSFPFSGYQPSSPWLNYTGLGVTGPMRSRRWITCSHAVRSPALTGVNKRAFRCTTPTIIVFFQWRLFLKHKQRKRTFEVLAGDEYNLPADGRDSGEGKISSGRAPRTADNTLHCMFSGVSMRSVFDPQWSVSLLEGHSSMVSHSRCCLPCCYCCQCCCCGPAF